MATKKYVTEKQRKMRVLIAGLLAVVILSAAFITGGILYSNHLNSGSSMRGTVAFESENFEVNNCMMTYFFYSDFYNTYNQYGSYFSAMGLDPFSSMQAQAYDEETSWFDYFLNNTANAVQSYILYAEAAKADSFVLDDINELIDDQIDALKETAENAKKDFDTYLLNTFGPGIKESDIRDALELQIYASKYYEKVEKAYADSLNDEDYEEYYEANKTTLDKIDYRSYTISAGVATDADEATKNAAFANAKADADSLLSAATSSDEFVAWVTANLTEKNADLETPLTEEEIKTKAETVTKDASIADGSDLATWAVEAGRKVGDTKLIDDGAGNYTVYMLEKAPARSEDKTVNVRHILIKTGADLSDDDAKAKADSVLAAYQNGEQTAEAFDALAKENNDDSNSLYENVTEGQMVTEFNDWIFDEARAEGDTGIVKTQYGYHVMYFDGHGIAKWQSEAYSKMLETHINDLVNGWQSKYTVDVDSTALYSLPDTIPAAAFQGTGTSAEDQAAVEDETVEV